VTAYNKIRHNAIVSIPVAASVCGGLAGCGSIQYNIGTVRNTGTELSVITQLLDRRAASWNLAVDYSHGDNRLVRLNAGPLNLENNPSLGIVEGYPLFSQWAIPIVSYADSNQNRIIDASEMRYGDSLQYVGRTDPKYQLNMHTDLTVLDGHLSMHATITYQNGMTQFNQASQTSGALLLLGNTPGISLATQAAIVAAGLGTDGQGVNSLIGLYQTVNVLRFQDLSINYLVPTAVAHRFHVPRMSVALQGSNLGLHTNYRGKDPNVNAFSTGNYVADTGELPQLRTWTLSLRLEN
jgi:hypothetical protein